MDPGADYEFKINIENPNGTFNEDSAGVTVTPDEPTDFEVTIATTTVNGQKFLSFSSNLPVQSVFLKGGANGSNLYDYAAWPTAANPQPVTYDEKLQVPGGSDISHVSFCFDELPLFPKLEIVKSPDNGIVNAGDPISFGIAVTNSGDAAALNVDIDDALPSGFVWTDDSDKCQITGGVNLHCDIDSLAAKASFTVNVSAPTDGTKCGPFPNTASTDADGQQPVSDDGMVTIQCADIRIEKTPDENAQSPSANDVEIGDAITFVLTVHNDGNGEARGVVVTDTLPGSGWSIVIGQTTLADCELTGSSLSCGPDTVAAGGSKKVTVTRTATFDADCGEINNTAFVDTSNNGEDQDSGNVDVLCADIEVDKSPDGATVTAGDEVSFTIVTSNVGNATATGVELEDLLPAVANGWEIDESLTDWTDCSITGAPGDPQTLECGPESIGAGGDLTVVVTTTVTADDCGDLLNPKAEATTTNDGSDWDDGDMTVLCAEIDVDKTPDDAEAFPGDEVSFTIVTKNLGNGEARDVDLTDLLPAVANGWEIDDSLTDWTDCSITGAAGDQQTLECGPEDIAAGQGNTRTVVVTTTVTADDCGLLDNPKAEATTSNDGKAHDGGDMTVLCPDVSIEKEAGETADAGDPASFTITVTAGGTGTSQNVTVTDDLIGDQADWSVDHAGCSINATPSLLCELGDLEPGDEVVITITYLTDADDCPSIANSATVSSDNDVDGSNNESDEAIVAVDCPDLELVKDGSDPVSAGDKVQFTLTVTNHGDGTAKDVMLTDTLPGDGLDTWVIVDTQNIDEADCGIVADVLTCELDELAADAWFSVTVEATTSPAACPSIANDASVSGDNEPGNDQFPNEDSHTITVNCPDVTIDKEPVESPLSAGEDAEFTIKVWNLGPGTAYDVEVTDTAPEGTLWTVLDADGFTCSDEVVGDQQTLTCTLDALAPGAENARTILIGFKTSQDDCGELDNAVSVFADNEPAEDTEDNSDTALIIVECPGLNMVKTADADPIDAGEEASFTITVWNTGPGDAFDVELHDDLPVGLSWDFEVVSGDATADDCMVASSIVPGAEPQMSIHCEFGTLGVTDMAGGIVIRVFADTTRAGCGTLTNEAWADASNDDRIDDDAAIQVKCPTIALEKENDAVDSVLPGTTVTYTLTLTVDDGPAEDVQVVDSLPVGLEDPTDISDGGVYDAVEHTITWDLGDLADGEYTLTYEATVADDVENGEELVNAAAATSTNSQCPDLETLGPECEDDSTVIVRVPTLIIDKVADVEVITISGPNDDLVADPSIVTWTLTYTLTNGPVTNAVITDEVPVGFEFLDASDGGTLVDGVVTWNFATLTESGSVTFRTTVDPETISRVAPTVNVAVIDSDETEPDEGEDSVTVVVEPPPLGGTPTPRPSLPNTAAGFGTNGEPVTIPVELLVAFFIGSLGALTLANVKARSRRS